MIQQKVVDALIILGCNILMYCVWIRCVTMVGCLYVYCLSIDITCVSHGCALRLAITYKCYIGNNFPNTTILSKGLMFTSFVLCHTIYDRNHSLSIAANLSDAIFIDGTPSGSIYSDSTALHLAEYT